jgi:hypothetical protein
MREILVLVIDEVCDFHGIICANNVEKLARTSLIYDALLLSGCGRRLHKGRKGRISKNAKWIGANRLNDSVCVVDPKVTELNIQLIEPLWVKGGADIYGFRLFCAEVPIPAVCE